MKKLKNFLTPDWKKLCIFFFIITLFFAVTIHYLVNAWGVSLILTSKFAQDLIKINYIQTNTTLSEAEKEMEIKKIQTESELWMVTFEANLEKLKMEENIIRIFPGEILRCLYTSGETPPVIPEWSISTSCYSDFLLFFLVKLIIIYLFSCFVIWVYEKSRKPKIPQPSLVTPKPKEIKKVLRSKEAVKKKKI
jgi:hypothetical protein